MEGVNKLEHLAFGKYVIVEKAEKHQEDNMTKGGILLPSDTEDVSADTKRSRVVSVSEELKRKMFEDGSKRPLQVGDIVYHPYHSGTPIRAVDGQKLYSVHCENILCIEIDS